MNIPALTILIYALFVLIGGMIGYNQAHSLASLIAGTVSGLLLLFCSIGMFKRSVLAYTLSLGLTLLLTLFFSYRLFLTAKFMPAGLMVLLSLITFSLVYYTRKQGLRAH